MKVLRMPAPQSHERLMRLDAATIFKRFFYLERALTVACAAWVPDVRRLDSKAAMARAAWQDAMTANALRERVFELRYPDRTLDPAGDAALIKVFEAVLHAPNGGAVLKVIADVFVPALRNAYTEYLNMSDTIADGPTYRFLELAIREKEEQEQTLRDAADTELTFDEEHRDLAKQWVAELTMLLDKVGGVNLEPPATDISIPAVVPPGQRFKLTEDPARDERYFSTSLYWPDNFDPDYPYGEGARLQLRSAVSHLNEVWAVETAGAILHGLANLGWEFIFDAGRWLYDESRHMMMGKRRLEWWGFESHEIPLGSYIYESCKGENVIYRLGMLAHFETKNIGKKRDRAADFHDLGDPVSERDMDFDWADEAIHTGFGRRWMRKALEACGRNPEDWAEVVKRCEQLVAERVSGATEEEKQRIREVAKTLAGKAEALASVGK